MTDETLKELELDILNCGLYLKSDIMMNEDKRERVIEIVKRCFG